MTGYLPVSLSAQAIAGYGNNHPHDPSDLLRCLTYMSSRGIDTSDLRRRMAGRSPEWDRLLPAWDQLVAMLHKEIAADQARPWEQRTGTAPLTYVVMYHFLHPKSEADDSIDSILAFINAEEIEFRELARIDWLDTSDGYRLHALAGGDYDPNYNAMRPATLACGRKSRHAEIPSMCSRMDMPRCRRCCEKTGLPYGTGSTKNDPTCRSLLRIPDPDEARP